MGVQCETHIQFDRDCCVPKSWIVNWVRLVVVPVCRSFGVDAEYVCMTKTRKGLHFYIGINPPIHAELSNKLQWLLGDDCRRVDFNRARIRVGYGGWNKLFERIGAKPQSICKAPSCPTNGGQYALSEPSVAIQANPNAF